MDFKIYYNKFVNINFIKWLGVKYLNGIGLIYRDPIYSTQTKQKIKKKKPIQKDNAKKRKDPKHVMSIFKIVCELFYRLSFYKEKKALQPRRK
jgi:hypothetical protein